jgi:hypothetical protein
MSFSIMAMRENHFLRGLATILCGIAGVVIIIGVFSAPQDTTANFFGFLVGLSFIALCTYTFVITHAWSVYEPLPFPKKAVCWFSVGIGCLFIVVALLVIWFVIAFGKEAAKQIGKSN